MLQKIRASFSTEIGGSLYIEKSINSRVLVVQYNYTSGTVQYNSIREYQGICSSTVGPRMRLGLILLNVRVEDERPIQSWVSIESEKSIKNQVLPYSMSLS